MSAPPIPDILARDESLVRAWAKRWRRTCEHANGRVEVKNYALFCGECSSPILHRRRVGLELEE